MISVWVAAGKLLFRLFGFLPQTLHGHTIAGQVHPVFGAEVFHQPVHDAGVEIVAAQVVVAAGGQHLDDAVPDLDQRHIKGTAPQVVDHDGLGPAVVQPVGQRRGGGLVDDPLDVQPGDAAGILGGLTLGVVEVGRHRDDRLGDRLPQVAFGIGLDLLQDQGTDLLRGIAFAVDGNAGVTAHLPLDAADGARGVGDGLPLGGIPHQPFPRLGERHHRRCGALSFGIGNDHRLATLDDGGTAVGGSQINSDDLWHSAFVLSEKTKQNPCFIFIVARTRTECVAIS